MHAWQIAATRRTHQQEPPGTTLGTWLQTPSVTNRKFIWRLKDIAQEAAQTRCPAASTQKLCCQPGLYLLRVKRLLLPRPHPARPRGARRVSQPRQAPLGCREGFGGWSFQFQGSMTFDWGRLFGLLSGYGCIPSTILQHQGNFPQRPQ